VDNRDVFQNILAGLEELARECPSFFPVHPEPSVGIGEFGFEFQLGANAEENGGNVKVSGIPRNGIILTAPLGYLDFLCLMKHAALVVTDSGGIRKKQPFWGLPASPSERTRKGLLPVKSGTNAIAGQKQTPSGMPSAVR